MTALRIYLGLVVFAVLGSGLSTALNLDPGPIAPVAAFLTLAAGFAALFSEPAAEPATARRVAGIVALGAVSEIVGLATGYPFGRYVYTGEWWPSVPTPWGPFPLLLPVAWAMVAGGAALALPGRPVLAALLATAVDLVMEPVMAGPLGYWRWVEKGPLPGGAPLLNAVGWFGVSLLAALLIGSPSGEHRRRAATVLAAHTAMTLLLGAIRSV